MKVSKYVTMDHVIASARAKRLHINNKPNPKQLKRAIRLSRKIIDPVFDRFGEIELSSFFRGEKLNKKTPGAVSTSQHAKGEAVDIDADGHKTVSNSEVFHFIMHNLPFDQLIWEYGTKDNPNWVHISHRYNGNQRGMILVAVRVRNGFKKNGEKKYKTKYKRRTPEQFKSPAETNHKSKATFASRAKFSPQILAILRTV